jgi:sortase (surface protein transpeptidase)
MAGPGRAGARLWTVVAVLACALTACGHQPVHATAAKVSQRVPASSAAPSASSSTSSDPAAGFRSPRTHPTVALPVRLRIPAIGVDTPLLRLGLEKNGEVEAPGPWQKAGWYTGSVRPGLRGPAVILGHFDSTRGPAVFYRLAFLRPGNAVYVTRADGSRVTFQVSGRQQVAKTQFPSDLVYGATLEPSLRLVTCGGSFDTTSGHYRDNIIVSAVLS